MYRGFENQVNIADNETCIIDAWGNGETSTLHHTNAVAVLT